MASNEWVFTQQKGPRRVFRLAGGYAPLGRPRQGAIFTDGRELQQQKTRYPGSSGEPTRHIFGSDMADMELRGRFSDKDLPGIDGAHNKARELAQFYEDKQPIRIDWGDVCSYAGIIQNVQLGREAKHEITYRIVLGIDRDLDEKPWFPRDYDPSPLEALERATSALQAGGLMMNAPTARGAGFHANALDAIDNLVSSIGSAMSQAVQVARLMEDTERGVNGIANRLISSVHQVRTGLVRMRNAAAEDVNNKLGLTRRAEEEVRLSKELVDREVMMGQILALLTEVEVRTVRLVQGDSSSYITAKDNESWESLSSRAYGSPDRADDLRQMNGIRYGEQPRVGRRYLVAV